MGKPIRSETSRAVTLNLSCLTERELRAFAEREKSRVSLVAEKLLTEAMAARAERQRILAVVSNDV